MPSFSASLGVLADHVGLGVVAAALFVAGLATSGPVVRHDCRALMVLPLWLMRAALRLMGPAFPPVRVFALIFAFNSLAIFLYMASGVLIVLPAAMAFLTGLHVGVIVLKARDIELPGTEGVVAAARQDAGDGREEGPPPRWVDFCGLAVLALELPSFWISVGMGIGMARKLTAPGQFTSEMIRGLFAERAYAYGMIVVPVLLVSAIAETAAIRGQRRKRA